MSCVQDFQKMIYQSYILLLLDYGYNTWETTSCANIEQLSNCKNWLPTLFYKLSLEHPLLLCFKNWHSYLFQKD